MESTGAPNRAPTRPNGKSVGGEVVVRLASPSLRGVVRTVLIVTACAIGLHLIWRIRVVVRLVAISLFFALTLLPIVDAVERKTRAPRTVIILAVYAVLIAAIALIGYVVAPSLVKEVQQLSHDPPATRSSYATTAPSGITTTATTSARSSCRTLSGCRSFWDIWSDR